ncbi:MAG TPA: M23 family metallopeptidase [Candidatus Limnocylindrales bacterium]|nr:M23 family metallopeptidase [Candidatus Limnocylindrales bacterium]
MPKPTDGVPGPAVDRTRSRARRLSTISRVNRRSVATARAAQDALHHRTGGLAASLAGTIRRGLRPFSSLDRALPILVATIVAVASLLAVLPTINGGAVGKTQGRGEGVRIALNGGFDRFANQYEQRPDEVAGQLAGELGSFAPVILPDDLRNDPGAEEASADPGNFLDDGTLLTGYAPDTEVADGADLITRYKVKSGDTLVTIAKHFGVKMMTLWWANNLKNKDELHIGQVLRIPPANGLVVTVKDTDTLDSLAAQYNVKPARVQELNGLDDPTLVVGQVLVLPGAKGAPIPTPKPTPKAANRPSSTASKPRTSSGHVSRGGPSSYNGGRFHWPVVGGGNYVSQYAHAGHMALDIAADYGSPVVAAGGGRVIFAGWKSNGGGWQVWINHGSGIYTTYNHMSSLAVGSGQSVARGQRVGRIGQSGWATGPHLHFEVWIGFPWNGGYQTNPMRYF